MIKAEPGLKYWSNPEAPAFPLHHDASWTYSGNILELESGVKTRQTGGMSHHFQSTLSGLNELKGELSVQSGISDIIKTSQ